MEALARPQAYPGRPDRVTRLATHISWVFLAGNRAYKLKRPVRYPFLDYSTLERRAHFCREEVRLNRRLAPDVYLGVVPITSDLTVSGRGPAVEYAVEMRRLPGDRMLDALVRCGEATAGQIDRIAVHLAEFHAKAETDGLIAMHGAPEAVRTRIEANLIDARAYLPAPWHNHLARANAAFLESHRAHIEERVERGRVRDGHGDLHAANICLPKDDVRIYDCIEFGARFRCCDVASEVAFLAMDLQRRGAWALAKRFVRTYGEASGDRGVDGLLPLFLRYRACIRGTVESFREAGSPKAHAYFRLALHHALPPALIVLCGLPASGKSHAARHLADAFGAQVLRSDVVRKELVGMAPTEHWQGDVLEGPYRPDLTLRTYARLRERARDALADGRTAVIDATCGRRDQRTRFRSIASDLQRPCILVRLTCDEQAVPARMEARARDPDEVSDADYRVYLRARSEFEEPGSRHIRHDGTHPVEPLLDEILEERIRLG